MSVQQWAIVAGVLVSGLLAVGPWMFMVHAKLAVLAAQVAILCRKVDKAAETHEKLWSVYARHEARLETHHVQIAPNQPKVARSAGVGRGTQTVETLMKIRDRIKELRRVKAAALKPHPKNWRAHPQNQRDALRGVLAEIGYADALLVHELSDGSLELIDGHLRAETTPEMEVPVLVLDLDEAEAAKLLALHDPLAGLAETDHDVLAELLAEVETQSEAVGRLLDDMLAQPDLPLDTEAEPPPEVDVPEAFQVVVECGDENQQRELFERLTGEGLSCRLLTL